MSHDAMDYIHCKLQKCVLVETMATKVGVFLTKEKKREMYIRKDENEKKNTSLVCKNVRRTYSNSA